MIELTIEGTTIRYLNKYNLDVVLAFVLSVITFLCVAPIVRWLSR